ncbi:MAG: response regulator transcription factor [Actinomycetia bacterium]|nr:response regulator transcription factor [Actinomycetes bacterium]MCP3909451.1 response regulator transcription factor [Actinomycetes bacterium]MCP4087368.1 response regulator transcription factor [Actinomycetes bacterium]
MEDSASRHILVVDDDPTVAEVVTRYLERDGFTVEQVGDGRTAVERVVADRPDLVLLDLMLPGLDGLEVCRRLRALAPVPIIMLTARGEENDRIIGLELGADDYMVKPFSPREVVSRVKAVLRRVEHPTAPAGPAMFLDGDLRVDVAAHEVTKGDESVNLTSREFELLVFLMRQPRTAFRREDLLEKVWGYSVGDTSTVTVHVRRLREKIEVDPANPSRIATVWGVGYRFEPTEDPADQAALS